MVPTTCASPAPIDVWDHATFDGELLDALENAADDILGYVATEHRIFLEQDLDRGSGRSILRPSNPYWSAYNAVVGCVADRMERRVIRAWHYTRMTDAEVDTLRQEGIHLSTPESLRRRLDAVVAAGAISADAADQLYAQSPFHGDQHDVRVNRFWMNSHPVAFDDGSVALLIRHWGGEVASMFARSSALTDPLRTLGHPRVIEIAAPVALADCGHEAAEAVIAAFGRSRGGIPGKREFNLRVMDPLPPTAVLKVHSEGDATFEEVGRT